MRSNWPGEPLQASVQSGIIITKSSAGAIPCGGSNFLMEMLQTRPSNEESFLSTLSTAPRREGAKTGKVVQLRAD